MTKKSFKFRGRLKEKEIESQKNNVFVRGYGELSLKVKRHPKAYMSCYSCKYFYKTPSDSESVCQNPEVLPYDLNVTEGNISCNRWKPSLED